jgi:hypothetical protein
MSCSRNSSNEKFDILPNITPDQLLKNAYPLAFPESKKSYPAPWPEPRTCFDLFLNRKWIKDGPLGRMYPALTVDAKEGVPVYNGCSKAEAKSSRYTYTCPTGSCRLSN